jgi:hypothetical protein
MGFALVHFRRAMTVTCVAAAGFGSACATHERDLQPPEATVLAFSRALGDGKLDVAYGMMSSDYRSHVSLALWKKKLEENAQETLEIGNTLSHVRGPASIQTVLRDGDGRELHLEREGESWRISSDVVEFYDQSTPRAALQAFVHAMQRKRYDVVLRLMPDADKEAVTTESMEKAWGHAARDEVERLLSQLREHLDDPIEVTGNRATMPYAERARVQFVREDGRWKIEDPE